MRRSTAVLLSCVRGSASSASRLDGVTVAKLEPGQATASRLWRAPPGRLLLLVPDVLMRRLTERGSAEYRHSPGRGSGPRECCGHPGTRGVRAGAGGSAGDAPRQPRRRPLALLGHLVRPVAVGAVAVARAVAVAVAWAVAATVAVALCLPFGRELVLRPGVAG